MTVDKNNSLYWDKLERNAQKARKITVRNEFKRPVRTINKIDNIAETTFAIIVLGLILVAIISL